MSQVTILGIAFLLMLAAYPLTSLGTTGPGVILWIVGLALLTLGGLIPPILRFAGGDKGGDEDDKADEKKKDRKDDGQDRGGRDDRHRQRARSGEGGIDSGRRPHDTPLSGVDRGGMPLGTVPARAAEQSEKAAERLRERDDREDEQGAAHDRGTGEDR